MGPLCRGPVWMPITPKRGVFLHADSQAREFARLAAVAKSLRDARHCRKFADMYWALALGDEPMRFQPGVSPARKSGSTGGTAGQNARRPSTDRTAGSSVRPAAISALARNRT